MADVNANIDINIDSSNALTQLKALQRQISQFHTSIAKSSESAALAQKGLQKNLLNSINAIGSFTAEMRTVRTSAESFTNSLEKNKFSMREYFRYAGASTKTFGKLFKSEFDTIGKVAEERVKRLQTQYIKMGRDTNGAMKAMSVMPTKLDMSDYTTKIQIAAQKQALFNQLMKQGSTNLLNFGKNTQWAGRQLMVGFTLPLMLVGSTATKTFMEMEAQALRFRKVYGDLFTPQSETKEALANVTELGKQFTKYGVAVSQTVGLAAEAAAAGFQGLDLQRQTAQATRLSILGQVESQKALETTISLQNAFGMSSDKLAESIDFLNAVENQTVVSLDDITTAIPKVAPVIQQLGGDVKDLTFFMAAMKEGGINASEGANALKSGLAALINPTKKASEMLAGFGINATAIVEKNKGNLKATVVEFASALNALDPLARARAIEQMFGKFQFARLSTLFANVAKDGNQAARVLALANSSVEELSALSEQELGMTADSAMNKFKKSVEDLKFALVPVGEAFLQALTPVIEFVGGILEKFGNLSDGTKKLITLLTVGIGAVGPVLLMTFGLLANGIANIIKLFLTLRGGYQKLTGQSQILGEQTQYMTMEQLDAAAAAHSLNQTHANLTQTFTAEVAQINKLIAAYTSAAGAARNFSMNNPGMMLPGRGAKKFANGIISVPGSGNKDTVPAMLTPGEAVVPAEMAKKYAPLINGMIADNIPGYQMGKGFRNATMFLPESINTSMGQPTGRGVPTGDVSRYLGGAGGASMAPLLAVIARELKVGLNNPKFKQEFSVIANLFAKTATDALNKSGREFIKDADLEGIVVPALRDAAKGVKIAGKDIDVALENAVNQIRTVGPVGVGSGSSGAFGRVALPGSYRGSRIPAQKFAAEQNPQMFASTERFSQSKQKIVKSFKTLNPALDKWETATMSHITGSVTASVDDLTRQMTPYLGDVGSRITDAITKKTIKGVVDKAKVASPSRETEMVGASIAQGFIVGAEQYVDDARVVGKKLGSGMVQTSSGLFVPGGASGTKTGGTPKEPGVPLSDIMSKARMNRETLLSIQQQKRMSVMNQRMDRLNKGFMSGTFALSALSGVASMAGGNLGKFSEILFQITGPLFALSSIIQLLTGNKIVSMISKFKVGFGLASLGLLAGVGIIKLANDARKKEIEYIDGLSNAMKTTTGQVKTLGDFFSVVPTKLPFENRNKEIVNKNVRTARDRLKEDSGFQKQFAPTIQTLSKSTAQEAQLAFTSLALNLKAQGFASEQVQTIIDALREEAGKTDVKLDVKSLNFSPESIKGLQDQIAKLLVTFSKDFNVKPTGTQKFLSGFIGSLFGETPKLMKMTDETKKSLSELTTFIVETSNSAAGMFKLGLISGKEFESSLLATVNTMNGLEVAARKVALVEVFKKLNVNAEPFLKNLQTAKQEMMLIALLSSGALGKDSPTLRALGSKDGKTRMRGLNSLRRLYENLFGAIAKVNEENAKLDNDVPKGPAKLNALQERIKAIKQQTQAYIILRNAKIDEKTATELSNDAEIASLVIANSKGKSLKYITGLINEYKKAIKGQTDAELKYMEKPNLFKKQLEQYQAQAELKEKIIDIQFAPKIKAENDALKIQEQNLQKVNDEIEKITDSQIKPIQAVIDANNFALESISLQEDEINEKYDKQIESLDKIATINQDIANIQKQRMSIADALTRGDISAAAQLAQEARAESAASIVTGQKEALASNRNAQIKMLKRVEIEKQNKILQLEISTIENGSLLTLQKKKDTIESTINSINRNIQALNSEVEALKNAALYGGKTRAEIDALAELIAAAEKAGIPFNDLLLSQAGNAESLAKALWDAVNAQKALASLTGLVSSAGGGPDGTDGDSTDGDSTDGDSTDGKPGDGTKGKSGGGPSTTAGNPPGPTKVNTFTTPMTISGQSIIPSKSGSTGTTLASSFSPGSLISKGVSAVGNAVKNLATTAVSKATTAVKNVATSIASTAKQVISNPISSLKNAAVSVAKSVAAPILGPIKAVSNVASGVKKLFGFSQGGLVPRYMANGGAVGSDTVPAMLTPGEFVVNKAATKAYRPLLERINESKYPGMLGSSGMNQVPVNNISTSMNDNSTAVYNYNLRFNINGANANAKDIANTVMREIKNVDSQRLRGQRL
jgi:TP901 family phage tail tape measure protein